MSYEIQEAWDWSIAIYLFLGGLGAAMTTLVVLTNRYVREHKPLVIWGVLGGIVAVNVGTLMLVIHLLDHLAVIYVLNPFVMFIKPDAWISWGVQFLLWMMLTGTLYAWPYIIESPWFRQMPLLGKPLTKLFDWDWSQWLSERCLHFHGLLAWVTMVMGSLTVVYTGLLLQSLPAVALWHNPGVPVLFSISAFSTALAALLIIQYLFIKADDMPLRHQYERADVILIGVEIAVVFLFFQYLLAGSEGGYRSAALLFNDWGWLIGFIGFGLIVPFLMNLKGTLKGWSTPAPVIISATFVLIGGYLLRHYFLYAGVYEYPW